MIPDVEASRRSDEPYSAEWAQPMRILRVITRLNIGGPSLHAALLSTQLDPRRFATCLVIGEPDPTEGDLSGLVQETRVRVTRLTSLVRPVRPLVDAVSLWRLIRIVWRERPQLIHTHMAKAGALGRLAGIIYNRLGPGRAPEYRAALVHTFHGHVLNGYFSPWVSALFTTVERWLACHTDCLIAVSPAIRSSLLEKGIGTAKQVRVVPLGLDLSALREVPPRPQGAPFTIGFVGRLVPIKHPSLFLQAVAQMSACAMAGSVRAVVAGDGPLRRRLEQEARELMLSGTLTFTGWQHDLVTCYQGLDVVCLTSWNEGTPVSLIEAMAAARAVVATDVGGVRDLLCDATDQLGPAGEGGFQIARRGLLVRAGDAAGLAAALARLADDLSLRQVLGASGRAHVVAAFNQERLLQDLTHLYQELEAQRMAL